MLYITPHTVVVDFRQFHYILLKLPITKFDIDIRFRITVSVFRAKPPRQQNRYSRRVDDDASTPALQRQSPIIMPTELRRQQLDLAG